MSRPSHSKMQYCETCETNVTGSWDQHIHGKRHRENTRGLKRARLASRPDIDPNIDQEQLNVRVTDWKQLRRVEGKELFNSVPLSHEASQVIDEVICRAKSFVHSEWHGLPEECIAVNEFLEDSRSMSVMKFLAAWNHLPGASQGRASVQKLGLFAWHGTNSNMNFPAICRDGWDPTRRARQAHGEGEYFGVDHDNTIYYSTDTKRLLVAYLIRGPHLEFVSGHCYIVSNPVDGSRSYCLPVLDIMVPPGTLPSHAIHPRRWNFFWENDRHQFEIYDEATHRFLTEAHTKYLNSLGSPVVTTPPVVRKSDGSTSHYRIDFKTSTQTHSRTGFTRKLDIRPVVPSSLPHLWHYRSSSGEWVPFFVHVVGDLMQAYIAYQEGQPMWGPRHRYNIRECKYAANFDTMTQRNLETDTEREITFF